MQFRTIAQVMRTPKHRSFRIPPLESRHSHLQTTSTMPSPTNHAAWLGGRSQPFVVSPAPMPVPAANELLVRNRAVAINPFDGIVQTLGSMVTPWLAYPAILGSDVAGEVVATGASVTRFQPGDRVLALALGIDKVSNRAAEGAFQNYVILREDAATKLPGTLAFEQAAVLPLALATAACGLFLDDQLALQRPTAGERPRLGRTVIVWGGSTSVGSCAIQLATAAGYDVAATASPRNFDYVRSLGATQAFDYNDPRVVDKMARALAGREIVGALSLGVGSGRPCLDLVARCRGRRFVAMASPPASLDDAPLTGQLAWKLGRLPRLAAGFLGLALRARVRGVKTGSIWGTALVQHPLGREIYADFLGQALADGRFVASPQPLVAGHSLQDIAPAMDLLRRGVSARKVVVSL